VIADALKGKTILVTGSTGFLGKSIVEKCLRSIHDIKRINLAIRSSARRPASERLEREVLASPAFKRLKDELGEEAFVKLTAAKLGVIEIDLGRDGLGLSEESRAALRGCDVVIH
jgi:fatty acyl-CoA reductase